MEFHDYIVKSVGILTIFYLVYISILRQDTHFTAKRHFLLGGLLAAVLLPFLEFTTVVYAEAPASILLPTATGSSVEPAVLPEQESGINWWQLLFWVYLVGVCIMSIRLMVQLYSLVTLLYRCRSEKKGNYRFVYSTDQISPFSFFNYIVYNPDLHQESELIMILQHEKAHATQWHSVDILLAHAIRILQWANPLSWFYKKSIEENLEFIADSATARKVTSVKQYQLALVKASSTLSTPALSNNFYQSFIKKRIIMLNKNNSKKRNLWKPAIILPLLALFLWSFNVTEKIEYIETDPVEVSEKEPVLIDVTPAITSEAPVVSKKSEPEKSIMNQPETDPVTSVIERQAANSIQEDINPEPVNNEVYILITKNTTKAELELYKKELKEEHNIDFNYSKLKFNSKGEISSIAIEFSDNKGSHGNYHVEEDDAINDFYFFVSEDGRSGFAREGSEDRMVERAKAIKERMDKRVEKLEEIKVQRLEKRKEMIDKRRAKTEQLAEKEKRLVVRQNRLAERSKELEDRSYAIAYSNDNEVDDEVVYVTSGHGQSSYSSSGSKTNVVVKKSTTDTQLAAIKEKLAAKGITFTYRNVKRNEEGEITAIKLRLKDGEGSESFSNVKSDDNEPISTIRLSIN
jgi:bla regulator protein BlaR1